MPLRYYKHKITGETIKTLQIKNLDEWDEIITVPCTKFMECANADTGKSRERGLRGILTERARNHSRDTNIDEAIQNGKMHDMNELVEKNFLNEKGQRRRKIDDI